MSGTRYIKSDTPISPLASIISSHKVVILSWIESNPSQITYPTTVMTSGAAASFAIFISDTTAGEIG
jgi:hypothetical protein